MRIGAYAFVRTILTDEKTSKLQQQATTTKKTRGNVKKKTTRKQLLRRACCGNWCRGRRQAEFTQRWERCQWSCRRSLDLTRFKLKVTVVVKNESTTRCGRHKSPPTCHSKRPVAPPGRWTLLERLCLIYWLPGHTHTLMVVYTPIITHVVGRISNTEPSRRDRAIRGKHVLLFTEASRPCIGANKTGFSFIFVTYLRRTIHKVMDAKKRTTPVCGLPSRFEGENGAV